MVRPPKDEVRTGGDATIEHPAPHRDRVALPALVFSLVATPVAWLAQLIVATSLASRSCFPGDMPLYAPQFANRPLLLSITVAAGIVGIAALLTATRAWHATRQEKDGDHRDLLEIGEGRTRFLALTAVLTSGGFLLAIVVSLCAGFVVPLCGQ